MKDNKTKRKTPYVFYSLTNNARNGDRFLLEVYGYAFQMHAHSVKYLNGREKLPIGGSGQKLYGRHGK